MTRVAVLDDYQRRAHGYADWESLGDGVEVEFFSEPMEQEELAGRLSGFDVRVRQHRAAVTRHLKPRRLRDADNQRRLDQFGGHHARGNLLRFLEDPRVEPTNNRSERGFRFAVIQRKVSQCSKTAGGAEAFAAFASVIKTAMRQGKDVVEWLSGLFRGIAPPSCPT